MPGAIEEMTIADCDAVAALWQAVGMWPHQGEDRDWLARAVARNPGCALVWRDAGGLVGTVIGAWDGLRGWIYHLAVAESHRRRGIGTALLHAAEARLKAAGVGQINLMVYEESVPLHQFYLCRGYEHSPVKVVRKRFSAD